jgi:DNA-binding SARP family transcriptional activator
MTAAAKGHDADSSTGHSSGAGTALSIAARDGDEVLIDLASISGLHLTGAGRDGVCRALLTAFLAAGGPDAAQVSVADDVYDAVTNRADPFPGLERVATLHELLSQAEVELVRRARLFATEDVDDLAAHRRAHPDEVLPARLLVVGDVPASQVERFRAILTVGGRLGLLGVIVGDPAGDFPAVEVDSSGVPLSASPDRLWETLHGTRLYTIGPEQATELLGILADARHDRESPSPVVVTEPFDVKPSPAAPIHVALFGPYRISAEGNELRTGLRSKARELLAFFLLHPEGATLEAAVEALWPEADPGRGPEWFWSALGNLRTRLRSATGQTDLKVIDRIGQIYQVDTSLFDVDLWRFQAAVGAAEEASDPKRVADALTRASEEYQGDFLDSAYFEWADAPREDLRRRAVDVAATLAELQIGAGEFEAAVRALERATAIDPYAEDLYRRLMRLQAQLGRIHAVRHTFARLESRLAELDVDPEPATLDLRDEILRAHSRLPSTEAV